jgi:hypothetical protein
MKLKHFAQRIFYKSFGIAVRAIERSLTRKPRISLIDILYLESAKSSAAYAKKQFKDAIIFRTRESLWKYCSQFDRKSNKLILEFGVFAGYSINFLACHNPKARLVGFDSFEGLKDDWYEDGALKGSISMKGKIPRVKKNVTLIKGWYENTIPDFRKNLGYDQISILHLDSDTYSSTKYVLNSFTRNLRSGSIIIFDEFFGYPNYEKYEFKAWKEFVAKNQIKFKCIGFSINQVAFIIK